MGNGAVNKTQAESALLWAVMVAGTAVGQSEVAAADAGKSSDPNGLLARPIPISWWS